MRASTSKTNSENERARVIAREQARIILTARASELSQKKIVFFFNSEI